MFCIDAADAAAALLEPLADELQSATGAQLKLIVRTKGQEEQQLQSLMKSVKSVHDVRLGVLPKENHSGPLADMWAAQLQASGLETADATAGGAAVTPDHQGLPLPAPVLVESLIWQGTNAGCRTAAGWIMHCSCIEFPNVGSASWLRCSNRSAVAAINRQHQRYHCLLIRLLRFTPCHPHAAGFADLFSVKEEGEVLNAKKAAFLASKVMQVGGNRVV